MNDAICPECGRTVTVDGKPYKGQWIACPHCSADLEVISVVPLELDFALLEEAEEDEFWDEEEAWEDEEEEDDLWEDDEDEEEEF
jgi:hypothetical protein